MVGESPEHIREVIQAISKDLSGRAFPGADDLQDPEWPRDPFHVLIATVLSQRTRDANTYLAAKQLFSRYDTPEAIAYGELKEIEKLIHPAGFYQVKAKGLQRLCRILVEEHGGMVPCSMEGLLSLPLVGRKTANCVLAYGFGLDGLCVDTHVHRISNRLGWVTTRTPEETEMALRKLVPKDLWRELNSIFVRFGQKTCLPQRPRCPKCPVNEDCAYYQKVR